MNTEFKHRIKAAVIDSPPIVIANYCIDGLFIPPNDPSKGLHWKGVYCKESLQ